MDKPSKYKFWNGMTLTEMFGAGNEPTDEQIEKIIKEEGDYLKKFGLPTPKNIIK